MVLPDWEPNGRLPPGVHEADWSEFVDRFGWNPYRLLMLSGLLRALQHLREAGCKRVYIDGSFVTLKDVPGDYDGCYDLERDSLYRLPPALQDFSPGRPAQKAEFFGELFPSLAPATAAGQPYIDFFAHDRDGTPKGIVAIDLTYGALP